MQVHDKNAIKVVTPENEHVGRIARSQAQQIAPAMDNGNKQLLSLALELVPLCIIVDCTGNYEYRLKIVGKDNRQLLSQKADSPSLRTGTNSCISGLNNKPSIVAYSANHDNGVSPVMEQTPSDSRRQTLVGHLNSITILKSKQWTNTDMSQMEQLVGAKALTMLK